jgi:hypothetical protein
MTNLACVQVIHHVQNSNEERTLSSKQQDDIISTTSDMPSIHKGKKIPLQKYYVSFLSANISWQNEHAINYKMV